MAKKITKKSQLALLKSIRSMLLELPTSSPNYFYLWKRLAILSLHPDLGSSDVEIMIIPLYNYVNNLYLKL